MRKSLLIILLLFSTLIYNTAYAGPKGGPKGPKPPRGHMMIHHAPPPPPHHHMMFRPRHRSFIYLNRSYCPNGYYYSNCMTPINNFGFAISI